METTITPPPDIYSQPPFNSFGYSLFVQIYYITFGFLTIFGNTYLIILFILFKKLRQLQCNWLIVYLSFVEILIGIGGIIRGILMAIAINYNITQFNFLFCSISIPVIFAVSYRIEQLVAFMIAIDRFVAIYKPVWYNRHQDYKMSLIVLFISAIVFAVLTFFVFFQARENNIFNLADIRWLTLDKCLLPITYYWYHILPSYSGIISIVFFIVYLMSLFLFWKTLSRSKKSQIHAKDNISKMQSRVFVTVSLALLSMTVFYVIPAILQMFAYYFSIKGKLSDIAIAVIQYGAELNGVLNASIYLVKHQEFRESSKRLFFKFSGKVAYLDSNLTNIRVSNNIVRVS